MIALMNPANPNATYIRMLLHRLERVMGFPLTGPGLPGDSIASVNPANPNATYIRMLFHRLERVMGFAPTASSLARKRSTAELHPRMKLSLP